ncbi:MAG: hypothetical protein M1827_002464 [Pycnora praestabilis]|nr:MAG: hypothetical protein M1827_002464 [Pycnora praestabilis]
MADDQEPTLLEYARFHGLARDHLAFFPLQSNYITCPPEDGLRSPPELKGLPDVDCTLEDLVNEKLSVSLEAAALLGFITAASKERFVDDSPISYHRKMRSLKAEAPILRTDHDTDVGDFREKIVPDLRGIRLPCENIDEDNDEGFTWPTAYYGALRKLQTTVGSEKLETENDMPLYLRSMIHDPLTNEDEASAIASGLMYKKSRIAPVTPPLLPLSPVLSPFIPSSSVGDLELLSERTSPTRAQLEEVDRLITARDDLDPRRAHGPFESDTTETMLLDDDLGHIYSPLRSIAYTPSSPSPRRHRPSARKVEGPLTPPTSTLPPVSKAKGVSFHNLFQEIVPELPPAIEKPAEGSVASSKVNFDAFFEHTVVPIAVAVNRQVEQESLQEADSTKRVDVPVMDFSLPVPPWQTRYDGISRNQRETLIIVDSQRRAISDIKEVHFNKHLWPGTSRIERELRWRPFSTDLGRVAVDEQIEDDGSLSNYLDLSETEVVDSGTLTWKKEGLRILDDDDEDTFEELQPGIFREEKDMQSLLKKRTLQLLEATPYTGDPSPKDNSVHRRHPNLLIAPTEAGSIPDDLAGNKDLGIHPGLNPTETGILSIPSNAFLAARTIDHFMDTRGELSKKQKLMISPHFPLGPEQDAKSATPKVKLLPQITRTLPLTVKAEEPLPIPGFDPPSSPRPFIVSSTLLTQRHLTRRIKQLYPFAEFIERDFTTQASVPTSIVSGAIHQSLTSPFGNEADIIVSPSTGIIWTTLQKVIQRSLPGQIARSAVKERVQCLAPRYERLLVLVSEGLRADIDTPVTGSGSASTNGLLEGDCTALVELMAFASSLDSEVVIMYIGGGEEELAQWIVGLMIKYGIFEPHTKLLQDETLWELFLRLTGLNAFAAQIILSELKAPDGDDVHNDDDDNNESPTAMQHTKTTVFGLGAFVQMSAAERVSRFEQILGGRRALLNVSARLDARWQ